MKYIVKQSILCLLLPIFGYAQVDSVDNQSGILEPDLIDSEKRTYVVYLQDSLEGPKSNIEIWDREFLFMKEEQQYQLKWTRSNAQKGRYSKYCIYASKNLKPTFEHIEKHEGGATSKTFEKISFSYQNDSLISSTSDSTAELSLKLKDLNKAFNWEMDLEILAALNWQANKRVAIAFYHPGSKTPPAYYQYGVVGSEALDLAGVSVDCWIIEHRLNAHQVTHFWLSKSDGLVLQVKDEFYGMMRFKKLLI